LISYPYLPFLSDSVFSLKIIRIRNYFSYANKTKEIRMNRAHALSRFHRLLCSTATCLLILPAAFASDSAPTAFSYATGVQTVPGTALIGAVLEDTQLWQKNGLQPQVSSPLGGGDRRAWTPEAENHSDIRLYGLGATMNYQSKGVDFVMVADLGTRAEWHMWSMADKPIRPDDVKDKRFAVTQLSGTDKLYADLFLKSLGIDPKAVTFVPTGGVPSNYQALKDGKADIWVTTEHAAALIDRTQQLRSIQKISALVGTDWDPYVILAKRQTLQERPELVERAVKTLLEAVQAIEKAPETENVQRLMQSFKVDGALAKQLLASVHFNASGAISLATLDKMRKHYLDSGIITEESLPLDRIYDASIVGTR